MLRSPAEHALPALSLGMPALSYLQTRPASCQAQRSAIHDSGPAQFAATVLVMPNGGSTPLILACVEGHDAVVQQLIAAPGIDVNVSDDDGNTPLIVAAFHNHGAVVAQLLAVEEIDANAKDTLGNSALFCACNITLYCCLKVSLPTISLRTILLSH